MNKKIQNLVKKSVRISLAYSSARSLTKNGKLSKQASNKIFLDANENAFGSVLPLIEGVEPNRYPDPLANLLRRELVKFTGVPFKKIFIGNGSDEIIWLLIFAFVSAGEEVIVPTPTFSMYSVFAKLAGAQICEVPLEKDFSFNSKKLLRAVSAKTKIIFLCSPNNPTGQTIPTEDIENILRQSKKIVVIDEAYIEFAPKKSCVNLLKKYSNLVILRTFSKAWGLAGLRIGYGLMSSEIVEILAKVRAPYSINVLSQKFAIQALKEQKKMKAGVKKTLAERKKLIAELQKVGLIVFSSDANFLLVRFPAKFSATKIQQALIKKFNIVVRDFSKNSKLKNCLRITVGTSAENSQLLIAFKSLLK